MNVTKQQENRMSPYRLDMLKRAFNPLSRFIEDLQEMWQEVGPDALASIVEGEYDADMVQETIYNVAEREDWFKRMSDEQRERILEMAFPEGESYGY